MTIIVFSRQRSRCIAATMTVGINKVTNLFADSRRRSFAPALEVIVLLLAIGIGVGSYFVISGDESPQWLLNPPLVALLLVANLLPNMALLVLIGRRVAKRRAARSAVGGGGTLHVQLVAIFSVMAAVPMLLVTIFASLLFQYGVEFWFSDRARGMLESASLIAQENYKLELERIGREAQAMSGDLADYINEHSIDDPNFPRYLLYQAYVRELSEAIIVHLTPDKHINSLALLDPYDRDLDKVVTPQMIAALGHDGKKTVVVNSLEAPGALTKLNYGTENYLFVTHVLDRRTVTLLRRGQAIVHDYHALLTRSRSLQVKFNTALLVISLLIVGFAVWIALVVADRLVRPVSELVDAARRVEGGQLDARVATPRTNNEIGTLANAFNQMTDTLQSQTAELVTANNQLDARRALIEAVMSGVTAGVISIGPDRTVRLINSSAASQLNAAGDNLVGRPLAEIAPELADLLDGDGREAIIQIAADGDPKTLAVKVTGDAAGQVLTFDDITQQLIDQRRAAWSDVARRIAHEIKNPLTPIQLAAERLQRRYGKQFDGADATFHRLTETIVRQVGDLRRMVDEFSSFARMPKPVFRAESLVDIGRQALFLHEVAHPHIAFRFEHEEPAPTLVCDRRQIGQALTNIVKNAVEAIEAKGEDAEGEIVMTLTQRDSEVTITVADDGVGLPSDRNRLVEPYMTTRARGTGLGLAIVKKIAEEHFGEISFADRPGGGTVVTMRFDTHLLDGLDATGMAGPPSTDEEPLPALTRTRNS
jgi:two-component system nitrogen regulation sensor histidine kinase NtrY